MSFNETERAGLRAIAAGEIPQNAASHLVPKLHRALVETADLLVLREHLTRQQWVDAFRARAELLSNAFANMTEEPTQPSVRVLPSSTKR